jgi:hypothetical protein
MNYLKDFFEPAFIEYDVRMSIETVQQRLQELLNSDPDSNESRILYGEITNYEFVLSLIPSDYESAAFSAAIKGTLSEQKVGTTRIEAYIMRDTSTYLTFLFSILAAIACLIIYFMDTKTIKPLIWGTVMLIAGSIFSIWLSNSSVKNVHKKFDAFLVANGII